MIFSDDLIRKCTKRLLMSRMRILCNNGFYGLLLMHARIAVSDEQETVWVDDGDKITFNPDHLLNLSDAELDEVLIDEIIQIMLNHLGQKGNPDESGYDVWRAYVFRAAEVMKSRRILANDTGCGDIPESVQRYVDEIKNPQTDWRTVLNEFIQVDIVDYSFTPPDRRFGDSPFFLPDFNEKDERIEKVLFMIDTSGSMSDDTVTIVYSEVRGAIEQFGGKLEGWLGFFDGEVVEPKAFSNEEEFEIIRPKGGGGTNFENIFKYVNESMSSEEIMSIVILTDGYAPFPDERETHGTPVLWLITNEDVTPPWGKVTRIRDTIN